jgi:environmental stress-induced protein Ves
MTNVLRHNGRRSGPWKNGGGMTAEVLGAPDGAASSDSAWRISIADVTRAGPFSAFEGVERIIMVIDGAGIILTIDGVERTVGPMRPVNFSGDAVTTARLIDGPTRDINVMTRRGLATAVLTAVHVTAQRSLNVDVVRDEQLVVIAVSGDVSILDVGAPLDPLRAIGRRGLDAEPVRTSLTALDAIYQGGPASIELRGDGAAAIVRLRTHVAPLSSS